MRTGLLNNLAGVEPLTLLWASGPRAQRDGPHHPAALHDGGAERPPAGGDAGACGPATVTALSHESERDKACAAQPCTALHRGRRGVKAPPFNAL